MQHRLASEELPKSSGLRKVRLTTLIESLQAQFGLARTLVALVVQNFDFAHLTIVGDVTSGPYGQANVKVKLYGSNSFLCFFSPLVFSAIPFNETLFDSYFLSP